MGFLLGKTGADYLKEYDKAYKDTRQAQAEAAADYYDTRDLYNANKDYFTSMGIEDPTASYWGNNGQRTNALQDTMSSYQKALSDLSDERAKVAKQQKYNIYGDGLLPSLFALNSFHQGGTALQDLITSGTSKWDSGERDALSDIGALGNAAVTTAAYATGLGGLAKGAAGAAAGNVAKKAATSAGQAFLQGAKAPALYGAVGSLSNYLQTNGQDSNVGGALGTTALGAGIGGLLGGTVGAAGYGINKLKSNAIAGNADAAQAANYLKQAQDKVGEYQKAMADASSLGLDATSEQALKNTYRELSRANHPDKVQRIAGLLPANASEATVSPYTEAVTKGTGKGNLMFSDIVTPEAQAINNSALEAAEKAAAEKFKPVSDVYNTLHGNIGTLDLLKGDVKAYQNALKNITNRATREYIGNKLGSTAIGKVGKTAGKLLSTKTGKIAATAAGAATIAKLIPNGENKVDYDNLTDEEWQQIINYYNNGGQ